MSEEAILPPALDNVPDAPLDIPPEVPIPCQFRTGNAGTGKTYGMMQEVTEHPNFAVTCATTGIAAVNLGTVTLNSLLRYYDTDGMRDSYLRGSLPRILASVCEGKKWLAIDEGSMLDADQLDILYHAVGEVNRLPVRRDKPLGILLIGDFAQLPPVKARFAFEAMCWPDFAANTTRLTKVWRQSDPDFLNVLNYVRHGHGADAARLLTSLGVQWHNVRDVDFPGTTLLPTNDLCRRHNEMCLSALRGKPFRLVNRRWGRQRNEWGLSTRTKEWGIPPVTELKLGCYVMIRANRPGLTLCNGDCGTVVGIDYDNPANGVEVMILRTGKVERVTPVVRDVGGKDRPNDWQESHPRISSADDEGEYLEKCHFRGRMRRYVEGQIQYYPLQLAYASTVHKSQGLSLDRVQVDYRHEFFGSPHMAYVALSRCRSLEGLRMVGMPEVFAKRVKVDARVRVWL